MTGLFADIKYNDLPSSIVDAIVGINSEPSGQRPICWTSRYFMYKWTRCPTNSQHATRNSQLAIRKLVTHKIADPVTLLSNSLLHKIVTLYSLYLQTNRCDYTVFAAVSSLSKLTWKLSSTSRSCVLQHCHSNSVLH